MAFDENLTTRIRTALARKKGVEEKKMFGGLCFLLHGHMLVGVWKDSLIARLGEEQADEAMLEPHVKPMDITGQRCRQCHDALFPLRQPALAQRVTEKAAADIDARRMGWQPLGRGYQPILLVEIIAYCARPRFVKSWRPERRTFL